MSSYFFGFSFWKRKNISYFFPNEKIYFCNSLKQAKSRGLNNKSRIYIWGKKIFPEVQEFAKNNNIIINYVEDGFIRSVTLGSDLTRAYSLVVDSRGIYFDPTRESDLEYILKNHSFDNNLISRAKELKKYLIDKKISKYNIHRDKTLKFNTLKKIILVVGQVEDDASIIYGGGGMKNIELLRKVKERRKEEFIIYKPHPDVLAKNRRGFIPKEQVLEFADKIVENISLPSLLDICDEIHTITSLSGFEGLIRGKEVYTYGMPFYAGWGLTTDIKQCKRRDRKLSIEELIAGAYILYPRYVSPKNNSFCEVESIISIIEKEKKRYNSNLIYRWSINFRNFISRKAQLVLKVIFDEQHR